MAKKDKILVIAEPDYCPVTTVHRATWLAQIFDCDLDLHFADAPINILGKGVFPSPQADQLQEWILTEQEAMANKLAEEARKLGITVRTRLLTKRPLAESILKIAEKLQPRFVVKATQYHCEAERAGFVHSDWQLIRECRYPLWLVKPHDFPKKPVILCAVDPMHEHDKPAKLDHSIIKAGVDLAAKGGGQVTLLHTFTPMVSVGDAAKKTFKPIRIPVKEITARMRREHRDMLDRLAAEYGIGKKQAIQLPGRPHEIIPAFAREKKADVVIMGALARWGLKRMILGSTAEKVLDHLPCDILIISNN